MNRALSKTILLLTTAFMLFAGIYGCKKTTMSSGQQAGGSGANTGRTAQKTKAAVPNVPTQEPVTDWYSEEENEFTLRTAGQLAGLAKLVNNGNRFKGKTIILGADINLAGYHANSTFNEGRGWIPIGSKRAMFKGTFDGNGKTVTGLYINDSQRFYAGLLGRIDSAEVKNVNVSGANITAHSRTGAIAGGIGSSTLKNCQSSGQIKGNAYVGGIAGYVRRKSNISDSYSKADANGNNYIGGIAGEIDGGSKVERSHSSGKVDGEVAVGGIAGGVKDRGSSVSNSYSSAKITTGSKGGGIAGQVHQGASIRNCYSLSEVSGRTFVGGIAGQAGQEGLVEPPRQARQQARQTRPRQTPAPITDTLSNNAALNPSVKATIGVAGRLQGHNNSRPVLLRNMAFGGITNYAGNREWPAKGDTGRDGVDITKEQIMADPTIGGRFTSENGWVVEAGKLPGFENAVLLPQHIR